MRSADVVFLSRPKVRLETQRSSSDCSSSRTPSWPISSRAARRVSPARPGRRAIEDLLTALRGFDPLLRGALHHDSVSLRLDQEKRILSPGRDRRGERRGVSQGTPAKLGPPNCIDVTRESLPLPSLGQGDEDPRRGGGPCRVGHLRSPLLRQRLVDLRRGLQDSVRGFVGRPPGSPHLTAREQGIVLRAVRAQLQQDPLQETRNRKRLRPNPLAPWELRTGDLRVFYDVDSDEPQVVDVLAIGVKIGSRLFIAGQEIRL